MNFDEKAVRGLFEEHGVHVGIIRLKHDGLKVYAFAETTSKVEVDKAVDALDSKEIDGRRLRVRSAKDKDKGPRNNPRVQQQTQQKAESNKQAPK